MTTLPLGDNGLTLEDLEDKIDHLSRKVDRLRFEMAKTHAAEMEFVRMQKLQGAFSILETAKDMDEAKEKIKMLREVAELL